MQRADEIHGMLRLKFRRRADQARESVSGASFLNSPALLGPGNGGREKIEMYENSLGIAWGTRF